MTGRRVRIVHLLAIALLAAGAWAHAHRDLPWSFLTGDEAEYAEVARRIANGRGFTTGIIYPIEVAWGVDEEHPSLLRAPLWPLSLAAVFSATGPEAGAVIATTAICHVVLSGLTYALAATLAGGGVGLVAAAAVATSPDVLLYAQFGGSEAPFALLITATFLLLARRADAFWIGLASGLAYLCRFNGALLLIAAVGLVALRAPRRLDAQWRPLAKLAAGFVLVASPWWIRNYWVTGDPTFSLYGVTLYFSPKLLPPNGSLIYMLEPDLNSPAAMHPLEKLAMLLPQAVVHWPLWTGNAVACAGWLWSCARRDRLGLSLFGVASVTTVLICMMALRGRYLIPFLPVVIALGSAAWFRFGGRLRYPALALLALAPHLPSFPAALYDTQLAYEFLDQTRQRTRRGEPLAGGYPDAMVPCLSARPLVIAQSAALLNWAADTVTLHMTRTDADFWKLVDEHPIEFVRLQPSHRLLKDPRFLARFEAVPECGEAVFRRQRREGGSLLYEPRTISRIRER